MTSNRDDQSDSISGTPLEGLAAVKRELAAVLLVGLAAIPLVGMWLDGLRELLVLVAYGVGGALWIRTRALGLILAARRGQRGRGGAEHGP